MNRYGSQLDPMQRAAECEQLMRIAAPGSYRVALSQLRDLWISLGSEQKFLTDIEFAEEMESICMMHDRLRANIARLN
jgi:hypothetical protein